MARALQYFVAGIGITLACLWFSVSVRAETPVLSVDPGDTPLRITGILDGQTTSFSGNVRLTASGGNADPVRVLASDLHHTTETQITIERSNVTLPANINLSNGQPLDVKVTIINVKRAGDYTGTLQLLLPGQTMTQAISVPLELSVKVKPDIQPVVAEQSFQVARCDWAFDCFLARLLLGGSVTRDIWHVRLDNQASQPATVIRADVVMQGNRTAAAVTPDEVMIGAPPMLPAEQVSIIPVTLARSNLLPDRYQGKLRFSIDGLDEPVTINGTLDVRNGPWWALVAIFLGIIGGRMARDMETPIAQKQVKLLPGWYDLRTKIDLITNQPARQALEKELQDARAKINSAQVTEDVASKFLEDLDAKVSFLLDLQNIEEKLKTLPANVQEQAKPLIEQARLSLLAGKVEEAKKAREQIADLILKAEADTMMGVGDDVREALRSIAGWLSRPAGPSLTQSQEALQAANLRQESGWRRFLAGLSGLQIVTAETRFWFFRPVLAVLLLVLLTLLGLQTLYVNAGATFGVGGLYDYLSLFLWGITADVAQRTLLNLPTV